jgi:NADH-quinone oxidoreductase subunit G
MKLFAPRTVHRHRHRWPAPSAEQFGEFQVRFPRGRREPKRVDLGERIVLDDERCIMCSRCIRFMKEIAHDDVLGFLNRGSHTTLSVYPAKSSKQLLAQHGGDICPWAR